MDCDCVPIWHCYATHIKKTVLKALIGVIEANLTGNSKNKAKSVKWLSKILSEFMNHIKKQYWNNLIEFLANVRHIGCLEKPFSEAKSLDLSLAIYSVQKNKWQKGLMTENVLAIAFNTHNTL